MARLPKCLSTLELKCYFKIKIKIYKQKYFPLFILNPLFISLSLKRQSHPLFKSNSPPFHLYMVFTTEGLFEVAIESWPEWDLNHDHWIPLRKSISWENIFKMRKYVNLKILRSIYFAIFDSYLSYCCLVWAEL